MVALGMLIVVATELAPFLDLRAWVRSLEVFVECTGLF